MTLTLPYKYSAIQIDTAMNGTLEITINNSDEVIELLFDQLLDNMNYDDIINTITPQSFENIMEYYKTNYKEE